MRIAVIGGGITGLSAAHALMCGARQRGIRLDWRLLERSARVGGVIRSGRRGSFLLEHGPDCFLSVKPAGLRLAETLGLQSELIPTNERHRRSFVVYRGTLQPLPEGIYLLAPTSLRALARAPILSWPGKIRMALDWIIPRRRGGDDESLARFVRRRLGREALDRLAQPMIAGIYMADPRRLSMQATFPQFLAMERTHGSLIRALGAQRGRQGAAAENRASGPRYSLFVSFRAGMQTLCDELAVRLPPRSLRCGCAVRSITRDAASGWRVELEGKETLRTDGVLVALPAWAAAPILRPADEALARDLGRIEYTWGAVLNLAYRRDQVAHPLDGMGMVVPAVERRTIAACTFCHEKFPGRAPSGSVLLRAFLGGALKPELRHCDDRDLLGRAHHDLSRLLGIRGQPLWTEVTRYPQALPQFHVGHPDQVARIRARCAAHPNLALAGNAYDGVGIPDCIRSGETAADSLLDSLTKERQEVRGDRNG